MTAPLTHTLACGMTMLIEPIEGVKSAAMQWLVPAGYAHDPADRSGRAAMLEELLLRGAGDLGSREHADALDRLGLSRSVSASARFISVSGTMIGDRFPDAFPLLADLVLRPRLEHDAVEAVRAICQQSLKSLADDPQERAILAARARHQPEPFNRSGYGDEAGLTAMTHDDLVGGWRERAHPVGSILAVAGAIDPEAVIDQAERVTSSWSGDAAEAEATGTPPRGYAHEADDSNQVQIVVAMDAPSEPEDGSIAERTLSSVLSGGMSGRLFTKVREERGLCYSVHASYRPERDRGTVTAYVGTTPERAQEALDVLYAELERLSTPEGAVTPDEFDRAVVGMKSRLVFGAESTAARAARLAGDFFALGRVRTLDELTARIDGLTLEGLNGYLSGRSLGRVTVQTLGPSPLTPPAGV
ncbi:MAG: pitrilysin family protein [Planctomycetota bacterium]